ncbi:serine hydrolase [Pantoea sp. Taur]|uniref:serine hydrolase domain-containing protein n=1 Tax=Pantoea sp. Taur TaxID=2576757 RepID=UPI00135480D8|nr:serine hydrolase domain-containing protein [Pantoea sp. Taur]MXP57361.1 beta-lactamase family protein [Pantoea sp. Taur]
MQKILKQVMQTALDEQRLVGIEVMVKRDGETLFHQAAGYADRESQRLMSVGERFRLASVSKPIVSTAAMMLVAAGRLSLDSDITRWLPTFKPLQPDGSRALITLRQLLSHSAGLSYRFLEATPDGPYARAGVSDGMDATPLSLQENLQRLSTVPLLFTPGTAWCYSLAMDVVGAIIEQVQQQPLPEAIRSLVTGPLGMKQTGFSLSADQSVATAYVSDTPRPHILSEGEVVAPFEGTVGIPYSPARVYDPQAFPSGGAGMVGTVSDLMTLLELLRSGGGTLLAPEWIAEMARDQVSEHVLPDMPGVGFGLGFSVLRDPLLADSPESIGTWRWGGAYGHAWFVDPQQALSVVAFTNTLYEGMSGQFVNDLRDAVYQALQGAQ